MKDYELVQKQLEREHKQTIDDIMYNYYIEKNLGPAMGAKELGIPRRAFVYFVQQCQLQAAKFDLIKKKALNSGELMAAL